MQVICHCGTSCEVKSSGPSTFPGGRVMNFRCTCGREYNVLDLGVQIEPTHGRPPDKGPRIPGID
jgi:hypothetical protein